MVIYQRLMIKRTLIIAEAGKNFIQTEADQSVAEYLANAKKLVDAAVAAGADAIKFQTHNFEDEQFNLKVSSPHFQGTDRYRWVVRNTLATPLNEFWKPLRAYCQEKGTVFLSTPMSRGAAQLLDLVGVELWKVGSADILDFVLLDYLRKSGKPIILSLGMSTLEEIRTALEFLKQQNNQISLLHCVSQYPCPPEELNLKVLGFYKRNFNLPIGFSDHSLGIESSLVAVALGAEIIEKHFSLSRNFWGPDHKVSLEPEEFCRLVRGIRELEESEEKRRQILNSDLAQKILGTEAKLVQEGEMAFRPLFRKSLVAAYDLKAIMVIEPDMIYAMRPQAQVSGLPSEKYEELLGRKLKRNLKKYEPITAEVLV